ncbi:aldolase/citrate lyase family protein [Microbacterium sp. LWS13-1.2]|uniref:Aldolase/citrate lyase family protein n=2 Tax=Microbacterium sp. LWS13-1.2 TaxID=3135264 RepID=A0AAU6S8J7_9MICO
MTKTGFWLADNSVPAAEIIADLEFDFVMLDLEHGMFDLATLSRHVPLLLGLGLEVFAKVIGPDREPIQQALDFGCTGVIVPHIGGLAHARTVTEYAKYPPVGTRSLASGRNTTWGPMTAEAVAAADAGTLSFPLIEESDALADIEKIAALSTVDGLMIGQADLSMSRGRGMYTRSEADLADMNRIVDAIQAAQKPWMCAGWAQDELDWAISRGASRIILGVQYASFGIGARAAKDAYDSRVGALR